MTATARTPFEGYASLEQGIASPDRVRTSKEKGRGVTSRWSPVRGRPRGGTESSSQLRVGAFELPHARRGVLGHRHGPAGRDVDQHHRLGARDHQLVVREPVRRDVVGDARAADAADADEALEQVVEAGRREVLDVRGPHHELGSLDPQRAEMPVVLGARVVEVRQVAAVVDDTLGIRVREPHARQRGVAKRWPAIGGAAELERVVHASALDQGDELVATGDHLRRGQRLEVEAEERLGVRRPHVEVPAVEVDRDAVEVRDAAALGGVALLDLLQLAAARRRPAC